MADRRTPLRLAIIEVSRDLTEAGVASPRTDAELLVAHVLGVDRSKLVMVPSLDPSQMDTLGALVARRVRREPLQHLLGYAPMGEITVEVGTGVFVPRPETELLFAWGTVALQGVPDPVVVDLCTGTGVLALAVAHARPDATVHAVDRDPTALSWARRNADARATHGDTPIRLHAGDVADPALLSEMDASVDLVVCNPPYVPAGTPVPPEVADHDPPAAVFAGADGLDVIRHVITCAVRLLRPGGVLAIEHDDSHSSSVPALLTARSLLTDVEDHPDLAGRPRYATARRR
ncbi:release factor glutamine methyltransferase [Herbihabitans rhizosphaerae]|uniref:Release factor glutamine methyltransferase n=1 Tax=Herbihabitans rhizosphaerae TaxID=1872711 RepID=A0A4Q7KEN6_9PSEU|nr:peptide chain release factor N(5)-glutamine methyltransferase [Herbihabitans rhizosphaerae]RZS32410.1 release factor glutamine methyltransferase [Herbihabitans rhizosphaerae]